MSKVDLSKYDNSWYQPGNGLKRMLWYCVNTIFLNSYLVPISSFKVALLRAFGAKIASGVVIKPKVNVKYPWNLKIGGHSWIGENVWIDNLSKVEIGSNVCLSQGAMLLTGNHNYTKSTFDLMTDPITLEDGVWIGAKSLVGPGVICRQHAVLSAKSFASSDLDPMSIYAGNPAQKIRQRVIS